MSAGFNEMLKPLSWLFGKWSGNSGEGKYPTVRDFQYAEEAEFFPVGNKPVIQYSLLSHHPANGNAMHRELGFINVRPNSKKVAFTTAHSIGVSEIQEGEVDGQTVTVATTFLGRTTFNKPPVVTKLQRTLSLVEDKLEQVIYMETDNTPMTEHLRITFVKNQ